MYQDQIFVLIGHNGAGKTTTISMLTGSLDPTVGGAELFGMDLYKDQAKLRQIMGVCPQYDVLFESLTCEEHLSFFYELKGANPNPKVKNGEIQKLMNDLGVADKKDALAF
jgi:ATP-binding cassette, subfamily A (ABC1), member 3